MPTEARPKTVVVAGATGRLGVIVEILLARGHSVRAMTRDPSSPAAALLGGLGVDLVFGDFEDPASIETAAAGADALFATGTVHQAGPDGELRHGRNVADGAAAAGVAHLVYSSGDGAAHDSPLPLFRVKARVEEHIRSVGVGYTILAPVYFMENLFNPWNLPALSRGILPSPVPADMPLQQVAIADLAALAALAIERGDELAGQRIRVASDELTAEQAAAVVASAVGLDLEAQRIAPEELPSGPRALFDWLERVGHDVDISALRRRYPEVGWRRYADWARSKRSRFGQLVPRRPAVAS